MTNQTRRDVLKKGLQVAAVGVGAGLIWDLFLQKSAKAQGFVPRPPGALPPDRFETACSKCGLCVEACPYDTLKLARFNDIAAPGTPFFTPRDIPCYMCRDIPCVKACPSGALSHELTDITEAKMGVAAIDHYTCLSWQGLRCEICYRDCPEQNKAIVIVSQPRQISNHAMFVPEIHPDKCTGCGLCVHSCPTDKPSINIVDPDAFLGKIGDHYRFTIARRFVQFCILLAFIGTFRFGWKVLGHPLLAGDLSSSRIFDTVPLADPFAALQRLVAQYWLSPESMIGAGIILAVYWVVSGRSFCSWVCPMNLVTDFAFWCRKKLGINTNVLSLSSGTRYVLLALALILSIVTGTAAFEAISPQGILWREIVYGGFLGLLSAVFGIFALDLAVTKRGWCGHLCPLGAFWALWGKIGLTKVKFDNDTCTRCGDCIKVCPEPQVINFKKAAEIGMYASGECTNCGKCVSICPENSLKFGIRLIKDSKKTQ